MYLFPHFCVYKCISLFLLKFHDRSSEKWILESPASLASRFTISATSAFKADNSAYYVLFSLRSNFAPQVYVFLFRFVFCEFWNFIYLWMLFFLSFWVKILHSSPVFLLGFVQIYPATGENCSRKASRNEWQLTVASLPPFSFCFNSAV